MNLQEITNEILLRSGQFIVAADYTQLCELQLNMGALWTFLKREIDDYARFKPLTKNFNIDMPRTDYDFSEDLHNGSNGPPTFMTKVVPVGWLLLVSRAIWFTPMLNNTNMNQMHRTIDPQMFLWNYMTDWQDIGGVQTRPMLVCSQIGKMDIVANYKYTYNVSKDSYGNILNVDIPELDDLALPLLFDILAYKFIELVGRSRRAFTYQDLPILTDAAAMVTEGREGYKEAREGLYNRSDWWKGITI